MDVKMSVLCHSRVVPDVSSNNEKPGNDTFFAICLRLFRRIVKCLLSAGAKEFVLL